MQLTTEQHQAIAHADRDMVLVAAAGAGKTSVLTEIAHRLLVDLAVAPANLAMITYTEKAAGELRTRIGARLENASRKRDPMMVGTIHHFAAHLNRETPLSLPRDFVIWEENRASLERNRIVRERLLELMDEPSESLSLLINEYGWRRLIALLSTHLNMRWKMSGFDRQSCRETLWPAYWDLYQEMNGTYRQHKRRHGAVDFEDLEESALKLLENPQVQKREQDRWRYILVDEYQDISPPQYQLIRSLHRPGSNRLIIVGDPHQSIYRFRGAEVSLFDKTRDALKEAGGVEIALTTNFRSTTGLLSRLNVVFAKLFSDYQAMQGVHDGDEQNSLETLELPTKRYLGERRQCEAERVSERMAQLIASGISPKDIAILFRSRAAMSVYEQELSQHGIPYRSQAGDLLLERQEVIDQLNVFRALVRPADPVAFAGVLLSPIGGLSAEGLLAFKGKDARTLLGKKIKVFDAGVQKIWTEFSEWWRELEGLRPFLKASELAHRIFLRTRKRAYYASGQARANLLHWQAFLEWMEQIDPLDLEDLVEIVEGFREDGARIYEVPIETNEEDAVSLMTVHAAKGLEFPVIVLADLTATIPARNELILLEPGEGIGLRYLDRELPGLRDQMRDSDGYRQIKEAIRKKEIEESRRLLYVACTRAKEKLILPLDSNRKERSETWNRWLCEALKVKG